MSELDQIKNRMIYYSDIMNAYHIENYDALRPSIFS